MIVGRAKEAGTNSPTWLGCSCIGLRIRFKEIKNFLVHKSYEREDVSKKIRLKDRNKEHERARNKKLRITLLE